MRSQKTIARRAAKANARRKDYEKKRNINRNVPTVSVIDRKEKYHSRTTEDGRIILKHIGYKKTVEKRKAHHSQGDTPGRPRTDEFDRNIGMTAYPKPLRGQKDRDHVERFKTLCRRFKKKNPEYSDSRVSMQVLFNNPVLAKKLEKLKIKK